MNALRAEFPAVAGAFARLRRPAVRADGPVGALVAAAGAGLIVRAVALLASSAVYPLLFPVTRPRPEWLTPRLVPDVLAEFAAGMVAARVGGAAGVGAYIALELVIVAAAWPARALFCERAGPELQVRCDLAGMIVDRGPLWVALLVGAMSLRALALRSGGPNGLLRAAGVFSLVVTVITNLLQLGYTATGADTQTAPLVWIYLVTQLLAGAAAGLLLARSPFAAAVLLAICVAAPALSANLPTVREALSLPPGVPLLADARVRLWASVAIPLAGAGAIVAARSFRREFLL